MTSNRQEVDFTLSEVAERLQVSRSKVSRLARSGELQHYKVGRLPRFTRKNLADFLGVDVASISTPVATPSDPGAPAALPPATRYTVSITPTSGKPSAREGLTAEQVTAYTAWLMVDLDTVSFTVEKEG